MGSLYCCRTTPAAAATVWSSAKSGRLCPTTSAVVPPARQSGAPAISWHGSPSWAAQRRLGAAGERDAAGGAAPETLQRIQGGEAGEAPHSSQQGALQTTPVLTSKESRCTILKQFWSQVLHDAQVDKHAGRVAYKGAKRVRRMRPVFPTCRLQPDCSRRPTMLPRLMCSSLSRSLWASIYLSRRAWGASWVPLPRGWAMVPLQWGPHPQSCLRMLQVLDSRFSLCALLYTTIDLLSVLSCRVDACTCLSAEPTICSTVSQQTIKKAPDSSTTRCKSICAAVLSITCSMACGGMQRKLTGTCVLPCVNCRCGYCGLWRIGRVGGLWG